MKITHHKDKTFHLQGKGASLIINPTKDLVKKKRSLNSDIVLYTSVVKDVVDSGFVITGAGEYEINGVVVHGISEKNKDKYNTIYIFEMDGINVAVAYSYVKGSTEKILKELGAPDILLLSIEDAGIDNLVVASDTKITIPTGFKDSKSDNLKKFVKSAGDEAIEFQQSYNPKKSDLLSDNSSLVLLELN